MTASVTFQEPPTRATGERRRDRRPARRRPSCVSKRAVVERGGQSVGLGRDRTALAALRPVTLGPERLDQVEVKSGLAPGEAVILNAPAGGDRRGRVRVKGA